jgi:hypothetical protein
MGYLELSTPNVGNPLQSHNIACRGKFSTLITNPFEPLARCKMKLQAMVRVKRWRALQHKQKQKQKHEQNS